MSRERLEEGCQTAILGLVLCVLVVAPLAQGAVPTLAFLAVQGLTIAALGLWLVRVWLRSSFRVLWPPMCWGVVLFTAYAAYRYRTADIEFIARGEFIRVLVYASLFFLIVDNLSGSESTQVICFTLVGVALAVSVYAIYQYLAGSNKVWGQLRPAAYAGRGSGTFICPNNLAGFLEMVVPLSLAYALLARTKHVTKIVLGYAALVALAAIGISFSRAGWLACLLSLLVFMGVAIRNQTRKLPYVIALVLLVAGAYAFVTRSIDAQRRMNYLYTDNGQFRDVRLQLWKPTIEVWRENTWFGVGPNHFDQVFPHHRPPYIQARPERAHNDYLNTLADWGVIGAGLVTLSLGLLAWGVWKTWRFVNRASDLVTKPSNRSAFVLGGTVGLIAILLHSVVDFNMHIPANALVAVTLMALLTAHLRFATDGFSFNLGLTGRILISLAIGAAIFFLGGWGVSRLREELNLRQAERSRQKPLEQLEWMRKAHLAEPNDPQVVYDIGQWNRAQSWQGLDGYEDYAKEAMKWFELGMRLNRHESYFPLRYGMCLHWLGRHDEAGSYFEKALALDPNSYYTVAHMGWHFFQMKDYPSAKTWFEKSTKLQWYPNPVAQDYLKLLERLAARP